MENRALAPLDQMLHIPLYFQIYDIPKASKCVIIESRIKEAMIPTTLKSQCGCHRITDWT